MLTAGVRLQYFKFCNHLEGCKIYSNSPGVYCHECPLTKIALIEPPCRTSFGNPLQHSFNSSSYLFFSVSTVEAALRSSSSMKSMVC